MMRRLSRTYKEYYRHQPILTVCTTVMLVAPWVAIGLSHLRKKYLYPDRFKQPLDYPLPVNAKEEWKRKASDPYDDNSAILSTLPDPLLSIKSI